MQLLLPTTYLAWRKTVAPGIIKSIDNAFDKATEAYQNNGEFFSSNL